MNNEVFHLLSGGVAQRLDAAEVRCVGLHQVRIELMVADNLAKAITHLRSAVVPIDWLRRQLLRLWGRLRWFGEGPDFLNGTDADPVSLTEGTIDGSRFGHTHFGAVDKKRNIGRIGIAVAYEAVGYLLDNGCFEDPTSLFGVGDTLRQFCRYAWTPPPLCDSEQSGMSYVPSRIQHQQVATAY